MCVNEEIYQDNPTRPNFPNYPQAVCPQDLDQEIQKEIKSNFFVKEIELLLKYQKHNCTQFSFVYVYSVNLVSVFSVHAHKIWTEWKPEMAKVVA